MNHKYSTQATGKFEVKSWLEKTWEGQPSNEVTGAKLTRASVTYTYQGEIEGEGLVEYLMSYREDGSGIFMGLERITGAIGSWRGSFVLQHNGVFEGNSVSGAFAVVPGSGTGDLTGLCGEGRVELVGHQPFYPFTLNYDLG